jgi:hypothetical protein
MRAEKSRCGCYVVLSLSACEGDQRRVCLIEVSVCVLEAEIGKFTVATCANIDHVVQILFNMIVDIAAELHVRVARLFVRGGILYA